MFDFRWKTPVQTVFFGGVFLCSSELQAAVFHVSPSGNGEGSSVASLGSLEEALEAASGGDEVVLHEGYYGDMVLSAAFDEETFVTAAEGETVQVRTLALEGAQNLTVSGLSVSLSHAATFERDTLVSVGSGCHFVTVSDCDVYSVPDSEIGSWTAEDWVERPGTAFSVHAPDTRITGNRIRNVGYGISINYNAPRANVSHNHIQNFSRDGLRGIADDGVFEYNTVLDAYDVDDHHDDFFQSWSYEDGVVGTTVVRGVVLRGNLFVNFTDPERPFAGAAQGIGCFDGFFEDWVVENNVVIVNHWHGITFLGARNMRIVNNTVLDNLLDDGPGPPWIDVSAHKDGSPSSDILIRNNLTQSITLDASDSTEDHNLLFSDPSQFFVDHLNFDLHLREDAEAIDTGSAESAASLDFDRISRPQGVGIDVGAFEWHDGSAEPVEGGADADPSSDGGGGRDGSGLGLAGAGSSNDPDTPDGEDSEPSNDHSGAPDEVEAAGCGCRQGGTLHRTGNGTTTWLALAVLLLGLVRRRQSAS